MSMCVQILGRPIIIFYCLYKNDTMFSPAQNFRALDFDHQSPPQSPAMTKRSAEAAAETVKEFVVHSFDTIDINKLSVKQRGAQKNEKPYFNVSYDHHRLLINLAPKKKWQYIPFAIEGSKYAKKEEGNTETVRVQVTLDNDVTKVIKLISDAVKAEVVAKFPDVKWFDSMKQLDSGELFTAKLVLKAPDEKNLTLCTVRPFKQDVIKAAGKDVVGPLLEANRGFAKSKVKLVVTLHGVWFMKESETESGPKGKTDTMMAGITWRISNLVADLPEQVKYVYQDVFGNVNFDEDDEEE